MGYVDPADDGAADSERYGIPAYVRRQWAAQLHSSAQRGIPFAFTLLGWRLWWRRELAKVGPHAKRGCRRGEYVMARIGDAGAYEPGNVYLSTAEANVSAANLGRKHGPASGTGKHLAVRGDEHPRSMAVVTPLGRFGSAALAAEAHGLTRQAAARKARLGRDGWQRL